MNEIWNPFSATTPTMPQGGASAEATPERERGTEGGGGGG